MIRTTKWITGLTVTTCRTVMCCLFVVIILCRVCYSQNSDEEQRETAYETVYRDTLYRIYFSGPVNGLYYIAYVPDIIHEGKKDSITIVNFERENFVAAFQKLIENSENPKLNLTNEARLTIATDLFTQIVKNNAKRVISTALALEKEKIDIGILRIKKNRNLSVTGEKNKGTGFFFTNLFLNPTDTIPSLHGEQWNVRSAQIAFEDGIMKDILVTVERVFDNTGQPSETFYFRNVKPATMSSPGDIADLHTMGTNILVAKYSDSISYKLDLAEVFSFDRRVAFSSGTYRPEDQVVRLTRDSAAVTLYKPSIEKSFDIRIYTDLTGIQENNPNGLVQVEGKYQIITNTRYSFTAALLSFVYFPSVSPFLTFSKIEDKTSLLPLHLYIDNFNKKNSFNYASTFDLLRYSHLHLGVEATLLSATSQSYKLKLNVTTGIFRTTVDSSFTVPGNDSLVVRGDKRDILASYVMPEFRIQFINSDRIDFEAGLGFMFSGLVDRNIRQTEAPTEEVRTTHTRPSGINSSYFFWPNAMTKLQANINIHPDPKDRSTAIFLRSVLYLNLPQNNLLLQIGYSTPIAKLFSNK